jgi:hypothetical protein
MLRTIIRKIQYGSIAILMCGLVSMANAQEAKSSTITFASNGGVKINIDGANICSLAPTAANEEWKFSEGIKADDMEENVAYFSLRASSEIQSKASITKQEGSADLTWIFSSKEDVKFNTLSMVFKLPVEDAINGTWKADDKTGVFPSKFDDSGLFGGEISNLSITTADGQMFDISFPKPTRVGIEDGRRWGDKNFKISFGKFFGTLVKGESYKLDATIRVPGQVKFETEDEIIINADDDWVPLSPELEILPGSALDLSVNGFTQGACGSKGRVIATPEGHFAFAEDPSTPQRFYGPNLCFTSQYMPNEKVDILLDRWVRMGFNTLRIHHYEFRLTEPVWKPGFNWDPKRLDQLCYLIAGCAKRGIWITTDLYVSRPISPKQISLPAEKPYIKNNNLVDGHYYKALVMVYEPAYQDFIKFTKQLLDHVNPYTGNRLAEEPVLAWINLLNEGAPGNRIKVLPQWKTAWNSWLVKRYPECEELAEALGDLKDDENPKTGTVEFPENVLGGTPRSRVCQVFMAETEKAFVERTRAFLRDELKCPALISNHNCNPHTVADQAARESFDYVDEHFYIDHPIFEKGWGLPSRCPNINPIYDGASRSLSGTSIRLWGKPMTISEYNFSGPGRFRGMGPLMTGALASLQDWDILWRFAYAHADKEIFEAAPMDYFNLSRDPLSLAADRAAVMLFLRGDLKTAPHRIAHVITQEQLQNPPAGVSLGSTSQFAWITRIGSAVDIIPKDAIIIPLGTSGADMRAKVEQAGIKVEATSGVICSETGEITLDKNRGILCIDTPKTAGGYAGAGESINASKSGVKVDIISSGATLFVTSLDNKPIRKSSRLLVTHLTDLQNTGAKYAESRKSTLLRWGKLPYLVHTGEATVQLSLANPEKYIVVALSSGGRRIEKIPSEVKDGKLVFTAKVRASYGARMLYEVLPDSADLVLEAPVDMVSTIGDILTFDTPFLFSYEGWKDKIVVADSKAVVKAEDGIGGGGYNINLDFSGQGNMSPVLYTKIGADNKAKSIKVLFSDTKGNKGSFIYDLLGKKTKEELRLLPRNNAVMAKPNEGHSLNLGNIRQVQILGDWQKKPVDLSFSKLKLEKLKAGEVNSTQIKGNVDILTFDAPFLFTHNSWENKLTAKDSQAVIKADNSRGGGGYNLDLNLSAMGDMSPMLYAVIGDANKAKRVKVMFSDGNQKNCSFIYDISDKKTGIPLVLVPNKNASISKPNEGSAIDLSNIKQVQILGDWSDNPVDLEFTKLSLEKINNK